SVGGTAFDAEVAADGALLVDDHGDSPRPRLEKVDLRVVAADLRLVDHVNDALGADIGAEPAQATAGSVDVDGVVALEAARDLLYGAARVVAHLDEAREVPPQLGWRHGDVMALEGLVVLRHVVLGPLGHHRPVEARRLLALGVARASEPSVHLARRAPAPTSRFDDGCGSGHEVAAREDPVYVGRERIGIPPDEGAAEVELKCVVGRAVGASWGRPVERIGAPRGDRAAIQDGARI